MAAGTTVPNMYTASGGSGGSGGGVGPTSAPINNAAQNANSVAAMANMLSSLVGGGSSGPMNMASLASMANMLASASSGGSAGGFNAAQFLQQSKFL